MQIVCQQCGKQTLRYPYQIKSGSKYCSNKCLWESKKGKARSQNTKEKLSKALLGRRRRPIRLCLICGNDGVRIGRKYCSRGCSGKSKLGMISNMKGKKHSPESLIKMGKAHTGKEPWNYGKKCPERSGKNCHLWKGGVTKLRVQIRGSQEYRDWRRLIFERDNYTCIWCRDKRGGNLQADHIKTFKEIVKEFNIKTPEDAINCKELWDINNGRTLCKPCHEKTDSYPKNLISKEIITVQQSELTGKITVREKSEAVSPLTKNE